MGQRSQIYIRYTDEGGRCYLTARYYGWNFGERMVSRLRHTIEWVQERLDQDYCHYFSTEPERLIRILDTNFDMKDVVISTDIIKEYQEDSSWKDDGTSFNEFVFELQHCNDGKLFIDIKDGKIKYAFLDRECNTGRIMTASRYMSWNVDPHWKDSDEFMENEARDQCVKNLRIIKKIACHMSKEEVEDFISHDYEADLIRRPVYAASVIDP